MQRERISSCYLDTSLITAAMIESVENHVAARDFCARLVADNATVWISELVRLEYLHFLRLICPKLAPEIIRQYGLNNWHRIGVRRNWIALNMADFDAFMSQFAVAHELALTRGIVDEGQRLMIDLNLPSNDAAHVATALAVATRDIAAIDAHFSRAQGSLTVHIVRDA